MALDQNMRRSRHKKPGENLIALPGSGEIFFRNSPFIMGGKRQRHLAKADVDIRMMIAFLSFFRDAVDKRYAL